MATSQPKPIMAANWKMHTPAGGLDAYFASFLSALGSQDALSDLLVHIRIVFAVPFVYLPYCVQRLQGTGIEVFAQDAHEATQGAFTGDISPDMLTQIGVHGALIGHSERRRWHYESSETVALKTKACIEAGLHPIVCLGETLEDRQQGRTESVLTLQLAPLIRLLAPESLYTIAYEPLWAIGTGLSATPTQAEATQAFLRGKLPVTSAILYGGSLNAAVAKDLMAMPHIEGGLVGGASLKPQEFAFLCTCAAQI